MAETRRPPAARKIMALSNLGGTGRTLLVNSMTLSLVLLNTVFTLSNGFDRKYVAKFVGKDFVISTADYFNYKFETSEAELTTSFVEAVGQHEPERRPFQHKNAGGILSAESDAVSGYTGTKKGNPYVQFSVRTTSCLEIHGSG